MSKFLSGIIAAGLMSMTVLSAQDQNPGGQAPRGGGGAGSPQQPAPSAQASTSSKTVTVSGCIQNAPAAAAGGGAAASTSKFVLSMKPAGAGAAGGGAVGTAGAAGTRYSLEGDEKTISPHLNHQVEITGQLQGAAASATSPAGAASATATPTLRVESVKMISATCS